MFLRGRPCGVCGPDSCINRSVWRYRGRRLSISGLEANLMLTNSQLPPLCVCVCVCVARSVQPKELGSQLFIDLPSCFVSLSLYSLREEVSVAVVRAFPVI